MVSLDESFAVSDTEVGSFQRQGFLLMKNVASKETINHYRPFINNSVKQLNREDRRMSDRDTYGKAFLQTMNLWEADKNVKEFTLAKRFGSIAAALLGVESVRLYHDQALFKEPGGGFTPWHQDQFYWPLQTTKTVTMWMPLMDITPEMGMLTFASGSHKDGLVTNIEISDESEKALDDYVREKKYSVFMPSYMNAGDATFHYGTTLHKAPGNSSPTMREVMTVIYFENNSKVSLPINDAQEKDRLRWLNGISPGEVADSNLNPVI
jgi:ectoine hydroxylase-related dioxygenase (phytanoyl-CoA dioxygenase family)